MPKIDVDDEVFSLLQKRAIPLVDTPNSVLRRLLLGEAMESPMPEPLASPVEIVSKVTISASTDEFISKVLNYVFPQENFARRQMLYEGQQVAVYLKNFNKKGTPNLWYRLYGGNWKSVRMTRKDGYVMLTNPSERLVLKIPVTDILSAAKSKGLRVETIEVNISMADMRWKELGIDLKPYSVRIP